MGMVTGRGMEPKSQTSSALSLAPNRHLQSILHAWRHPLDQGFSELEATLTASQVEGFGPALGWEG